jgi:hypothetical protein
MVYKLSTLLCANSRRQDQALLPVRAALLTSHHVFLRANRLVLRLLEMGKIPGTMPQGNPNG